jgi:hypothetical protein
MAETDSMAPDVSRVTTTDTVCGRCGRQLEVGRGYRFAAGSGPPTRLCVRCALRHGPVVWRALQTALVVGTILIVINQGDAILSARLTAALLWKIPLTYAVPYLVSTYSALAISREQAPTG